MTDPLLATKWYVPRLRAGLVQRSRLIDRLTEGVTRPLTLLSAPAGFGKTTVVSAWHAAPGGRAFRLAWLALDAGDNDAIRFWTYAIAALRTAFPAHQPEFGAVPLRLLRSPQPPPIVEILTLLINEIASDQRSAVQAPVVLVLDDYHLVESPAVHHALDFLLEHLAPSLRLVILTRSDPPLALARLRARDLLCEVRADDLRFTTAETAEFLNSSMGLSLTPDQVEALAARAEGWIAGLQMAALSMRDRRDAAAFVREFSGSHRYIMDYLVQEVLDREPAPVQEFLLQTSILDRLTAELCDAVVQGHDGQALLARLEQANLFLVPLDDERRWYRYHHLFVDLLRARLLQSQRELVPALHLRASEWYEANGTPADAIAHALAAHDHDRAARLIEPEIQEGVARGELSTIVRWIHALPADVVRERPPLAVEQAFALAFAGQVERIEPLLQPAEAQIKAGDPTTTAARDLLGTLAAVRAFVAVMLGQDARAIGLARDADAVLPPSSYYARTTLPFVLGHAFRGQAEFDRAAGEFAHIVEMADAAGEEWTRATGTYEIAVTRRYQGRLREAAAVCREGLRRAVAHGTAEFGSFAKLDAALAEVLCEQNALDDAHTRAQSALARMQAWTMPTEQLIAALSLLHVQVARRDAAGARATIGLGDEIRARAPVFPHLGRLFDLAEVDLLLATGDVDAAARVLDRLGPGNSPRMITRRAELLALARVRLAQAQPDAALALLAPLERQARDTAHIALRIQVAACQAPALDACGRREQALACLTAGLELGEPEGFVRVWIDAGETMRRLMVAWRSRLIAPGGETPASTPALRAYVDQLLAAFVRDDAPPAPAAAVPVVAASSPAEKQARTGSHPALIEPLSEREMQVLRAIAAGWSNHEIARKLIVAPGTVKAHLANIYRKLDVHTRTQALARAADLDLL